MSEIIKINNVNNDYNNVNNNSNLYNVNVALKNRVDENNTSGVKQKKANGTQECQTCKNRKYQDSSNDPGVSFKSPTNLSPQQAATAVASHEREHYTRESSKAQQEGREVVSNTISIFTSICPECGKTYVSGGETNTVTKKKNETQLEFAKKFFDGTVGKHRAQEIDTKV